MKKLFLFALIAAAIGQSVQATWVSGNHCEGVEMWQCDQSGINCGCTTNVS